MSQQPQDLQQERELLEHFRQHSRGEPSAALDALILDAARQAVAQPAARPRRAQRLHAWLFGAGSRTRWSVAFASLATLGIGLSLTWRTQERVPSAYDLPAPVAAEVPAAAPVLREMAPGMAGEARKQSAEHEYKKAEAREPVAGASAYSASPPAAAQPRLMAPAKPAAAPPVEALADSAAAPVAHDEAQALAKAKQQAQTAARAWDEEQSAGLGHSAVDEAPPLELRLRNVLQLRKEGRQAEADRLLAALRREHPQLDLDAELQRLQAEAERPASSR